MFRPCWAPGPACLSKWPLPGCALPRCDQLASPTPAALGAVPRSCSELLLLPFATRDQTLHINQGQKSTATAAPTVVSAWTVLHDHAGLTGNVRYWSLNLVSWREWSQELLLSFGVLPGIINAQFVLRLRYSSAGSENTVICIASLGGRMPTMCSKCHVRRNV